AARQAAPGRHVTDTHPGPVVLPQAVLPAAVDLAQQQRLAGPVQDLAQDRLRPVPEHALVPRPTRTAATAGEARTAGVVGAAEHGRVARAQDDGVIPGVVVGAGRDR